MSSHLDARLGLRLLREDLTTLGVCPGRRQRAGKNQPRQRRQNDDGEHDEEDGHDGIRREKLATSPASTSV